MTVSRSLYCGNQIPELGHHGVDNRRHRSCLSVSGPLVERDLKDEDAELCDDRGAQSGFAALDEGRASRAYEVVAFTSIPIAKRIICMDERAYGRGLFAMLFELFCRDKVEHEAHDFQRIKVGGGLCDQVGGSIRNLVAAEDHLAFIGEIPKEGSRREAGASGDLRNRGSREPLLGEQL